MKREEEIILTGHFYVDEMTSYIHTCGVPSLRASEHPRFTNAQG